MRKTQKNTSNKLKKKTQFIGNEILFISVILICFLIVRILPFLFSITYSFTDWNGITGKVNFNGLSNFFMLKEDKQFWYSLIFTIKFSVITLIGTNLVGFTLGYFLTKQIKIRNILRAGYYMPSILGGVVLGFVWRFIFIKIFPAIGRETGIHLFKLLWLATPNTSFWALVIVSIWIHSGFFMLLYVAGFTSIEKEMTEIARMDGANSWNVLTKITIPLMMPTITRALFLSIIYGFKIYTLNYSLTAGGPYNSSESIAMNIYRTAFTENAMGYGSAKSLVFIVIVVIITVLQVYLTSKKEVEI